MKLGRITKKLLADAIFVTHCVVVLIVGFGWLIPSIWFFYVFALFVTLISDLTLGYCFLSKWEFDLRKQIGPSVDYEYDFSSYYTYKLTRHRLSKRFISSAGNFFLIASLAITIYFKFFF